MAEIQDKCQCQHGYMHAITLFAVEWQSVANKIASEPITCGCDVYIKFGGDHP